MAKPKPDSHSNAPRKYLTEAEAEKLISAAGLEGRNGSRDRALLLVMYRHGLRVSEAVNLAWNQIELGAGRLHVNRLKGGINTAHPIRGPVLRALRAVRRDWPEGDYVFQSERGGPLSRCMVNRIIERAAEAADLGLHVHPHMLRHGCGYKLANDGTDTRTIQEYLGHANIQHTVRYTALAANRFNGLWKD